MPDERRHDLDFCQLQRALHLAQRLNLPEPRLQLGTDGEGAPTLRINSPILTMDDERVLTLHISISVD